MPAEAAFSSCRSAVIHVMLALEEILEFALPLFAMLAVWQCRFIAQHDNVTK